MILLTFTPHSALHCTFGYSWQQYARSIFRSTWLNILKAQFNSKSLFSTRSHDGPRISTKRDIHTLLLARCCSNSIQHYFKSTWAKWKVQITSDYYYKYISKRLSLGMSKYKIVKKWQQTRYLLAGKWLLNIPSTSFKAENNRVAFYIILYLDLICSPIFLVTVPKMNASGKIKVRVANN